MKQYRVTWEIDIEAETPLDAALQAEAIQRAQVLREDDSERGVFNVREKGGSRSQIDLAAVENQDETETERA